MQQRSTLAVKGQSAEPLSLANAFADTVLLQPSAERPRAHAQAIDSRHVVGMVNAFGLAPDAAQDAPTRHHLPLRFSGSGLGYFWVWIVNLLLTLLTGGLFYPWAKARRLRYFGQHTLIDGHAFDFHGAPHKMLLGLLLAGGLLAFLAVSAYFSPVTGLVALLIAAGVWPVLQHSALRFRVSNTSWRGQRLRFHGRSGDSYAVLLPMFLPALVIAGAQLGVPPGQALPGWYLVTAAVVAVVSLLAAPWVIWQFHGLKRNHIAYGALRFELRGSSGALYAIVGMAVWMLAALLVPGLAALWSLVAMGELPLEALDAWPAYSPWLAGGGALLLLLHLVPGPYLVSRLQNLLWSQTGNSQLRFKSELRYRALLLLTWKNALLLLLTAGLYWPFARVAMARLRLEAISLTTRVEIDELVLQSRSQASPRAMSSLFSMDVGW